MRLAIRGLLLMSALSELLGSGVPLQIQVKVLNAYNGKPFQHWPVTLIEARGSVGSGLPSSSIIRMNSATTDNNGVASYRLDEPLPDRITFYTSALKGCIYSGTLVNEWRPREIQSKGFVQDNVCGKKRNLKGNKFGITPTPGEIVLFALPAPKGQW